MGCWGNPPFCGKNLEEASIGKVPVEGVEGKHTVDGSQNPTAPRMMINSHYL